MRALRNLTTLSLILVALLGMPGPASAAESFDSCAGFIDTVPMVISTQGTWCLRHNLSTSATGINAIEIDTSNVTIDCNGYKLGNGPAGTDTGSIGIFADGMANITVRHCTILGFHDGISIDAGTPNDGHLIEDNVLSQNRVNGMIVKGNGVIVQRNRVIDTGGNSTSIGALGIGTSGDVIDNVVDGSVAASGVTNFQSIGIQANGNGLLVQGNRVRNLVQKGASSAVGIAINSGTGNEVRDNYVVQGSSTNGVGIGCVLATNRTRDNVIRNYTTGLSNCSDDGGNVVF